MLNQGADAVCTEFVAELFRVVTAISGQGEQVAGVPPGDLLADLRSCFFVVVQWTSVTYSVTTSTSAVTFSERTR